MLTVQVLRTVGEVLFRNRIQVLLHLVLNARKLVPFESELQLWKLNIIQGSERKASECHHSLCRRHSSLYNGGHAWELRRHSKISGRPNGISGCFWFRFTAT